MGNRRAVKAGLLVVALAGFIFSVSMVAVPEQAEAGILDWFFKRSPNGCQVQADKSHPSTHHIDTVNGEGRVKCTIATKIRVKVWQDRSSWTGWRSYSTPSQTTWKTTKTRETNSARICMAGTYDYRTRAYGESVEGGRTYSRTQTGVSGKVRGILNSQGVVIARCTWG